MYPSASMMGQPYIPAQGMGPMRGQPFMGPPATGQPPPRPPVWGPPVYNGQIVTPEYLQRWYTFMKQRINERHRERLQETNRKAQRYRTMIDPNPVLHRHEYVNDPVPLVNEGGPSVYNVANPPVRWRFGILPPACTYPFSCSPSLLSPLVSDPIVYNPGTFHSPHRLGVSYSSS